MTIESNKKQQKMNRAASLATALAITMVVLSAIPFVTPVAVAQQQAQQGQGGGNADGTDGRSGSGSGDQDRNQTRTQDPSTHSNEILQDRWRNQTQTSSDEVHRTRIGSNPQSVEPYIANLNYTLTAEGNAISFTDSSATEDASVTIQMSTWRSNERIVSMSILEGTITIGDREENIQAGNVYYLPAIQQIRVYGLVEYEGEDGNMYVKMLRITSSSLSVENPLPTDDSEPSYTFESSLFSRLDAEYYLRLSGQADVVV